MTSDTPGVLRLLELNAALSNELHDVKQVATDNASQYDIAKSKLKAAEARIGELLNVIASLEEEDRKCQSDLPVSEDTRQQLKTANTRIRALEVELRDAKVTIKEQRKRSGALEQRNAALEREVANVRELDKELQVARSVNADAWESATALEACRTKLEQSERDNLRLKSELSQVTTGAPDSLLRDLHDIVPYSCWVGTEQDVAIKVIEALNKSGRFEYVKPHSYDRASHNMYFICRLHRTGNQSPPALLIGCNLVRRSIRASVHQPGQHI